eukprot:COSAG05_NODE_416_length_10031_cov_18.951067_16_plen_112_part_00
MQKAQQQATDLQNAEENAAASRSAQAATTEGLAEELAAARETLAAAQAEQSALGSAAQMATVAMQVGLLHRALVSRLDSRHRMFRLILLRAYVYTRSLHTSVMCVYWRELE